MCFVIEFFRKYTKRFIFGKGSFLMLLGKIFQNLTNVPPTYVTYFVKMLLRTAG